MWWYSIVSFFQDLIKRKVPNAHVRESILLASGAVVYTYSQAGEQINDQVTSTDLAQILRSVEFGQYFWRYEFCISKLIIFIMYVVTLN